MYPELFSIGKITIYTYGVLVALGFFIGMQYVVKYSKDIISKQQVYDFLFYVISYCISNLLICLLNSLLTLSIWLLTCIPTIPNVYCTLINIIKYTMEFNILYAKNINLPTIHSEQVYTLCYFIFLSVSFLIDLCS